MSKMNRKRVFLGGLLAGVVIIVLGFAAYYIYLGNIWKPVLEAIGYPMEETVGMYIGSIIGSFVVGILAVWRRSQNGRDGRIFFLDPEWIASGPLVRFHGNVPGQGADHRLHYQLSFNDCSYLGGSMDL